MTISLRQLRYFVAVAEERNFGQAAKRLNVSQPPITRQIQQLEQQVGASLLVRTPRGAILTEAGREFLQSARDILLRLDRAQSKSIAIHQGRQGTLDLGYFGSIGYIILPEILRVYCAEHLNVRTQVHRMSREEQVAAMLDDRLHVGFGRNFPNIEGLSHETVLNERLVLCLPSDADFEITEHNWKDVLRSIPMVLFPSQGRPNFADDILGILMRHDINPQVDLVAEDACAAMIHVSSGSSFSIVPTSMMKLAWSGVKVQDLPYIDATSPLSILYRKTQHSALVSSFIEVVRRYALTSSN